MDLISNLPFDLVAPKPLTLLRRGTGSYVNHKWVKGEPSEIEALVLLTPVIKQSSKNFLPEALRSKKTFRMYSNTELKDFQEGEVKQQADEFVLQSETYRVVLLGGWSDVNGFTGYEAYACKVDSDVLSVTGN